MYYKTLNINGKEYPLAVNITGEGAPSISGAIPGMIYFDELNKVAYIRRQDGSWENIGGSQGGSQGGLKLYLHTIAFNQSISSPEGEPFDFVYLYVITTDPTPAEIDFGNYGSGGALSLRFNCSQILAAYGGWKMSNYCDYYIPVELCINHQHNEDGDVYTFIEQAVIPDMTARGGNFDGGSTGEVVLNNTKFHSDTVTAI